LAEARITRQRLRTGSSHLLGLAGALALEASRKLVAVDGSASLEGDRWVEWSFCLARLADGPGATLDFGADIGFLSLAAAQRGHRVTALDRVVTSPAFQHERVEFVYADILDRPLEGARFDQIVNCSSVEHVGLAGRYGSTEAPDGDLEAMAIMRDLLAPNGRMILTVPVGRDLLCPPLHRVYGADRLPRLLERYAVDEEQFWWKGPSLSAWTQTDRNTALATKGSASFYSLGLFVLAPS
jgi:SAM-dependent methyltransferase